jgi:hypothetical protein
VALAIVVTAVLHVALPAKYRVNPPWVGPAVALALLAALIIGDPGRIDRGGAAARAHHPYANPAFVFPEMMHTGYAPATWVPNFADYLSLACWTATAFSPTDVSAIKRWAKLLMMIEAVVSLGIGALVIARAINILK